MSVKEGSQAMAEATNDETRVALSRLRLVLDWTNSLYASCGDERAELHARAMAHPGRDATFAVELTWSSIGPIASRLLKRGLQDPRAALAEVERQQSLFEDEEVRRLSLQEGFSKYKQHIESVELLRLLLARVLELLVRAPPRG